VTEHDRVAPIVIPPVGLQGLLGIPRSPSGVVVFAHGSGSGRLSPRNNMVASALRQGGLGTLLFDLLTEPEAADRRKVFDIPLLAERLLEATSWLRAMKEAASLPIGYFGASTGAAAALAAAAEAASNVAAVVSRGGRPDLADAALPKVQSPTLLIVGGADEIVLDLNRQALARLLCEKQLVVVPGAGHLFEEPGTLEQVVNHARRWFLDHFTPADNQPR
jgi:putative phosphoribosyl transferase